MKDFINWDAFVAIAELAGPVGIVVILLAVAAVFIVRSQGWTGFGDKTKMVASTRLDKIDAKLTSIDKRLVDVENDIEARPTKHDLHKLDLILVRQDERLKSIDKGISGLNSAVTSINEFMREASLRLGEDRSKGDRK